MKESAIHFVKQLTHPVKGKLFLLFRLPSAFFSGVRIQSITEEQCVVTVPYKWFSQNPFRSTYFACLAMAAEMTTGVLGLMQITGRKPAVSMLVVGIEGNFFKKATDRTTFICDEGKQFEQLVEEAIATGEAKTIRAKSTGRNKAGEIVAEFYITWSFKAKA
nr:DUF4442 domain-containing protein [uncultured Lacibacter sp.]